LLLLGLLMVRGSVVCSMPSWLSPWRSGSRPWRITSRLRSPYPPVFFLCNFCWWGFGGFVSEIGLRDWLGLLLLPFVWCYVRQRCCFSLVRGTMHEQRNM
jgi:hypothetical protein